MLFLFSQTNEDLFSSSKSFLSIGKSDNGEREEKEIVMRRVKSDLVTAQDRN